MAIEASPTVEPPRLLPRRLGRYLLFAHIGRGGMADIHLAQADTGFGDATRLVVIKEMRQTFADSREFSDMLVAEAKLAARLSHANVVKVEDLGRVGDSLFIAMEYVEGLDLRELLRRCAKQRVALPVEFSLRIVVEALRGLSFAHRAKDDAGELLGLVHRDVSPSNVLLSFDGEVKVCDFGIARANRALAEGTSEEAVVGKAGYMSPEHARGEVLDARADVFAAGIILWELLSGRRLYRAADGAPLLEAALAAVIPDLPDHGLPREPEIRRIVHRALAARREDRYPTAAAMLEDLEDYAASTGLLASQLRLGEWLLESFGQDVVGDRRGRERAMRALARGPVAVIRAVEPVAVAAPPRTSFLPEYEATPSQFMVAPRATDEPPVAAVGDVTSLPAPTAEPAPVRPVRPERRGIPTAVWAVGAVCALGLAARALIPLLHLH